MCTEKVNIDIRKDKRSPIASSKAVQKSMQGNKSKNTHPEIFLRKQLFSRGFRGYRLHLNLPGKPDISFIRKRVCIFVHGCFWHRCPYCKFPTPKTNEKYWKEKFKKNIDRDHRNEKKLIAMGWNVIIVWECELKKQSENTVNRVIESLSP